MVSTGTALRQAAATLANIAMMCTVVAALVVSLGTGLPCTPTQTDSVGLPGGPTAAPADHDQTDTLFADSESTPALPLLTVPHPCVRATRARHNDGILVDAPSIRRRPVAGWASAIPPPPAI